MVSVIIACYNDQRWLNHTVEKLYEGQDSNSFEVIVMDDCSDIPINLNGFPVRILRNGMRQGVGYCFDRGVKEAIGATIVLMGSDVLVRDRSWLSEAIRWSDVHPNAIGAAISYCFSPTNQDFEDDNVKKTYGADISWIHTHYKHAWGDVNAPADYCIDIINASSITTKLDGDIVPCLIGAFYVTKKDFYVRINGWDTDGSHNKGHRYWGGLEPWISIKTWLAGGEVRVIDTIDVGHIYSRIPSVMTHRGVRADFRWYNKLFMAHTLFMEHEKQGLLGMVERLYKEHGSYDKNYGIAKKMIAQNKEWVNHVMRRNDEIFIGERGYRNLDVFKQKFGITLPWEV